MLTNPRNGGGKPLYSPRLLLMAAALAGILILSLAEVLTHGGPGASAASPPGPRSSTPGLAASPALSPASSPSSGASGCNVPPGSQAIPGSAPPGVSWQLYQMIALPFSASSGPTVISGDVARCYAHSPTGALLAAVQIYIRIGLAQDWRPVVSEQVMPGTGRDALAAVRPGETVTVRPGEFGQIAAFQFVTYSGTIAVVQIVVRMPNGSLEMGTLTVVWSGGDWRLELEPSGKAYANVQQLPNLTGFIQWGGV
jgi:hypothetical protein